jgi:hypothetical protein
MIHQKLEEFRLFYNHTIHPELMRMERLRRRLLWLFAFSFLALVGIFSLSLYLGVLSLTLFLMMPVTFYMLYLGYRFQKFRATFKPHVVNLVLDFMDNDVNYGTLRYSPKRSIPKELFLSSEIFITPADVFEGEDYIEGKIGELPFEMCELNVRELSKVRERLNYVFRGVFLHTVFNRDLRSQILVLPREYRQYLSRSIRAIDLAGGENIDQQLLNSSFTDAFMTYATPEAPYNELLSHDMQQAIAEYRQRSGKEIYLAFRGRDVFLAVTQPKDMLEPFYFRSNVSFELVREYFEDVQIMIQIIAVLDANN